MHMVDCEFRGALVMPCVVYKANAIILKFIVFIE